MGRYFMLLCGELGYGKLTLKCVNRGIFGTPEEIWNCESLSCSHSDYRERIKMTFIICAGAFGSPDKKRLQWKWTNGLDLVSFECDQMSLGKYTSNFQGMFATQHFLIQAANFSSESSYHTEIWKKIHVTWFLDRHISEISNLFTNYEIWISLRI